MQLGAVSLNVSSILTDSIVETQKELNASDNRALVNTKIEEGENALRNGSPDIAECCFKKAVNIMV